MIRKPAKKILLNVIKQEIVQFTKYVTRSYCPSDMKISMAISKKFRPYISKNTIQTVNQRTHLILHNGVDSVMKLPVSLCLRIYFSRDNVCSAEKLTKGSRNTILCLVSFSAETDVICTIVHSRYEYYLIHKLLEIMQLYKKNAT